MAMLLGPPPKVIWLRAGNQPSTIIAALLRQHARLHPCLRGERRGLPGNLLKTVGAVAIQGNYGSLS
jgi:hypothetical protein